MNDVLPFFKALADDTRLRIVNVLLRHELKVSELVDVFQMGQSRISRHLKILAECGLLTSRRDGSWVFYAGAQDGRGGMALAAVAPLIQGVEEYAADLANVQRVLEERSSATKRFFDSVASDWDRMSKETLGDLDLTARVVEILPPCSVVLDMGCGPGHMSLALLAKAEHVIAVDSSAKMLDQARDRLAGQAHRASLRIGELEHLPVREGEAQAAVLSMVLHHLPDPAAGVLEAYRALDKGGVLVLADFAKHDHEKMRAEYQDRWLGFTEGQIRDWLARTGFTLQSHDVLHARDGLDVLLVKAMK